MNHNAVGPDMCARIGRTASQVRPLLLLLALALIPLTVTAARPQQAAGDALPVPFGVGERLEYDVKFSRFTVGRATMETRAIEEIRGRRAWHVALSIRGRFTFYSVNDRFDSWFSVDSMHSLRFQRDIRNTGYKKKSSIEIFPDRQSFAENGGDERPSVAAPLDDASFLYWVRTIALEPGDTLTIPRHYNPASNPVGLVVLRRDTARTPAGTFPSIVLQPTFRTRGVFGDGGRAEVWLSDDASRRMVQMRTSLKVGSITLLLRGVTPAR